MLWTRPWIVTVLAIAVTSCTPSVGRCDKFAVVARDLEAQAFPAGTVIELRVFKQLRANNDTPDAIRAGSLFTRGTRLGAPLTVTTKAGEFTAQFEFTIDVNDKDLTGDATRPDRTVLLELRRNGGNTAIVPFIAVGDVDKKTGVAKNFSAPQILNVAVPEPRPDQMPTPPQYILPCYPTECNPPCSNSHGRFRLFRH